MSGVRQDICRPRRRRARRRPLASASLRADRGRACYESGADGRCRSSLRRAVVPEGRDDLERATTDYRQYRTGKVTPDGSPDQSVLSRTATQSASRSASRRWCARPTTRRHLRSDSGICGVKLSRKNLSRQPRRNRMRFTTGSCPSCRSDCRSCERRGATSGTTGQRCPTCSRSRFRESKPATTGFSSMSTLTSCGRASATTSRPCHHSAFDVQTAGPAL